VGGRYSDTWHRLHLIDPRSVVPSSIMPAYARLDGQPADRHHSIQARLRALVALGHPYSEKEIAEAPAALEGRTELDAVIAYLQSLGRSGAGASQP
jgi:cytochrome c oxidase cbb3-type subunit 2